MRSYSSKLIDSAQTRVPGHLHLAITVATMAMALRKVSPVEVAAQVEIVVALMELAVMGEANLLDIISQRTTGMVRIPSPRIRNTRMTTLNPKTQIVVVTRRNLSNSTIRKLLRIRRRGKAKVEGVRPLPMASRQSLKSSRMMRKKKGSFLK